MMFLGVLSAALCISALGLELNLNAISDTVENVMSETIENATEALSVGIEEQANVGSTSGIPPYAKTFPGCGCTWHEQRGSWSCEGRIAFPEELQGVECGCCGLKCVTSNRKSDEECLAGGFDQKAEMEAERKRLAELLKGADMLLSDDLPGFIVTLPDKGPCTKQLITKACKQGNGKEKDLTPLCDHMSYSNGQPCYTPAKSSSPHASLFKSRHFSHWNSHRALMKLDVDDEIFYGMCFYAHGNGNWALAPTGVSHRWTNSGFISPRAGLTKPKKNVPIAKMNDGSGELGSWRTICVKDAPNR